MTKALWLHKDRSANRRSVAGTVGNAKMMGMCRCLLISLALMSLLASSLSAQDAEAIFLARVNALRRQQNRPAYTVHAALRAAAANHARWLARTGLSSHRQEDGSGPRERAAKAGYSSSWVSENYYFGSGGVEAAWNFWLKSPVHYAGLVSPYYNNIGIASASSGQRTAYVLVFGNASGRLSGDAPAGSSAEAGDGAPVAPAYVLGLDAVGNIKHQVRSGDTIGGIALLYGYDWKDIPGMLSLNGMTWDDIRLLKPGAIFLVPPKAGTFTPTPVTPSATPSATAIATISPAAQTDLPATATRQPLQPSPTVVIRIASLARATPGPRQITSPGAQPSSPGPALTAALLAAILLQAGIIMGASIALIRRLR